MNLIHQKQGSVEIVEMPSQLVMANAPEMRQAIKKIIDEGGSQLILNLKGVEFIDSSGLSVLVSALKAANAAGGEVVLVGPNAGVRSLIELTQLHKVFEIFEDSHAASRCFNK